MSAMFRSIEANGYPVTLAGGLFAPLSYGHISYCCTVLSTLTFWYLATICQYADSSWIVWRCGMVKYPRSRCLSLTLHYSYRPLVHNWMNSQCADLNRRYILTYWPNVCTLGPIRQMILSQYERQWRNVQSKCISSMLIQQPTQVWG